MRRSLSVLIFVAAALLFAACGFHQPNQTKLDEAIPELNVEGDYHHAFYKMMVQKLRVSGVQVRSQGDEGYVKQENAPTLYIPTPSVDNVVVAVDSRAQALQRNLLIKVAMTLDIPNHRPLIMRNSLTRTVLNKTGHTLASSNEIAIVIRETYDELSSQMVLRLSYLGRESDPDFRDPLPQDLIVASDDPDSEVTARNPYAGMTLMEALQSQDHAESAQAAEVSLDQLNNGRVYTNPKLPPVTPELRHQAPQSLNTNM